MDRRDFLGRTAIAAGMTLTPFGLNGWAAVNQGIATTNKRVVVIFLRGAVDGLNVVVPYGDSRYYDSRPTIAIQRPGTTGGAIDLDGYFGIHPALTGILPFWKQQSLAFVLACGSPNSTRSHFDAQDYMESGTPGRKTTPDGWMNRLFSVLPGPRGPTQAVSLGPTLPRILRGKMPVANLPLGRNAAQPIVLDRPVIAAAFDQLYGGNDSMSLAYQAGQVARKQLMSDLQQDMKEADNGAPSAIGFASDATHLAQLIGKENRTQLAFVALGGWDTHVNQGASEGQLARHLSGLGEGLAALAGGLGSAYKDTVILVVSEFGRTVRENGNAGTDHGHGNVMWVMGGPVRGGKVYGDWLRLDQENLYEGRDVPVTTDFRNVIAAVLERHLGLSGTQLASIFPDAPKMGANLSQLMRA